MPGTEAGFSTEMTELEVTLATVDPVAVVGLALNLCRCGWNCNLMTSGPAKQFETEIQWLYFPNLRLCLVFGTTHEQAPLANLVALHTI